MILIATDCYDEMPSVWPHNSRLPVAIAPQNWNWKCSLIKLQLTIQATIRGVVVLGNLPQLLCHHWPLIQFVSFDFKSFPLNQRSLEAELEGWPRWNWWPLKSVWPPYGPLLPFSHIHAQWCINEWSCQRFAAILAKELRQFIPATPPGSLASSGIWLATLGATPKMQLAQCDSLMSTTSLRDLSDGPHTLCCLTQELFPLVSRVCTMKRIVVIKGKNATTILDSK